MIRLKQESSLSCSMSLLKPALGCQVQAKVELGKVISRVSVCSEDKVGSGGGAETNALFPCLNLVGLEIPAYPQVQVASCSEILRYTFLPSKGTLCPSDAL